MIEEIVKYRTMGKVFNSMQEAKSYRFDRVGEFLNPAFGLFTPGEKLKLVRFLVDNRAHIITLLDY